MAVDLVSRPNICPATAPITAPVPAPFCSGVIVVHPVSKMAKAQVKVPADLNEVIVFMWKVLSMETNHSKVKLGP
jgi:hypothetical protein